MAICWSTEVVHFLNFQVRILHCFCNCCTNPFHKHDAGRKVWKSAMRCFAQLTQENTIIAFSAKSCYKLMTCRLKISTECQWQVGKTLCRSYAICLYAQKLICLNLCLNFFLFSKQLNKLKLDSRQAQITILNKFLFTWANSLSLSPKWKIVSANRN